jgi:uncharacterized protein YjbI with pentapeptide repeats
LCDINHFLGKNERVMKFEVKNRFSADVQFTADIDGEESTYLSIKMGLSVIWAIENGANLGGADLVGADLGGANLGGADLRDANLRDANLVGADLFGADLRDANLRDANLVGADLRGADLGGADLRDANLRDANLVGADLRGADLFGADLRDANLRDANLVGANLVGANLVGANLVGANLVGADLFGADLRMFKHDFWGVLQRFKSEIPSLINYIKEGKINGSAYSGKCACLMGTFAAIKGCTIEDPQFSIKDPSSQVERWFMMIKEGDTPENNFASKMALEWAEEFLLLNRV